MMVWTWGGGGALALRGALVAACVVCGVVPTGPAAEGATAEEILDATGVKGGLVVHVGCGSEWS